MYDISFDVSPITRLDLSIRRNQKRRFTGWDSGEREGMEVREWVNLIIIEDRNRR